MTSLQQTMQPSAQSREWRAIVVLILLIPVLWSPPFLFRVFLYQPFNIPSNSMVPTLIVGDYVFVAKYAYGYDRYAFPYSPSWISGRFFAATPEPGDVVVFRSPKDTSTDYIKRVVGLPGDRIQMRQGQFFLNDRAVTRVALPEVAAGAVCGGLNATTKIRRWRETLPNGSSYETYDCVDNAYYDNTNVFTVPPDHLFVLGDNRDNSSDSRAMAVMGFVPMDHLIGRAARIFWSITPAGEPRGGRIGKVR